MVCFGLLLFFVGSLAATSTKDCDTDFVLIDHKWCIFINITVPVNAKGEPLTWPAASESCKSHDTAYLVSGLDNPKKFQAISHHIDQACKEETKLGWIFWVGAIGTGNTWQWASGPQISLQSNIWMPNQPSKATGTTPQYGRLVLADSTHGRRYLVSDTSEGISPAYVCEHPVKVMK